MSVCANINNLSLFLLIWSFSLIEKAKNIMLYKDRAAIINKVNLTQNLAYIRVL